MSIHSVDATPQPCLMPPSAHQEGWTQHLVASAASRGPSMVGAALKPDGYMEISMGILKGISIGTSMGICMGIDEDLWIYIYIFYIAWI